MNSKQILLFVLMVKATLFTYKISAQQVLTLEQCRGLALATNNNLKISQQHIEVAKAQKAWADAVGKPALDGSVLGFYFGEPLSGILPQYGISPGVGIKQPVYAGGKIKLGKEAASKEIEIGEIQKIQTTTEVLLRTETTYWQIVSVNERIKLAAQFKKQLDTLYTDLNNQFAAGLIYKNDVLRVKVRQDDNELNSIRAKDALLLSKLNLAQLIGRANNTDFIIADSAIGSFNHVQMDDSLQHVITKRPEIMLLQKFIEGEKIQEKMLRADLKPTIGLSANAVSAFGKQGIDPTKPGANALVSYYGFLNVSIPVFDWGIKKQKIKQQQFRIATQQLRLKETEELISLEVQQAYIELNESAKRVELSGTSLQQAEENVRLSNDRFKAGTIIGKDVLEAQTIWQQAYSNIIEAKVAYKVSEANLKKALGEMK
ncbi:MAG TPA: TolC family protein [Chitinophagaceae bacterium]|nr:TolC family protein [Chitinophagaceae bacterium]